MRRPTCDLLLKSFVKPFQLLAVGMLCLSHEDPYVGSLYNRVHVSFVHIVVLSSFTLLDLREIVHLRL